MLDPKKQAKDPAAEDETKPPEMIWTKLQSRISSFAMMAIAVGLALVIIPSLFEGAVGNGETRHNLLMSAGLAILLTVFGGQGVMRTRVFILAGAAALSMALFGALEHFGKGKSSPTYALGQIANIKSGQHKVNMTLGSNDLLGSLVTESSQFRFVVLEHQRAASNDLIININPVGSDAGTVRFKLKSDCITPYVSAGKQIGWSFDASRRALVEDTTDKVIALSQGDPGEGVDVVPCITSVAFTPEMNNVPSMASLSLFTTSAHAQDSQVVLMPETISFALANLASDVDDVRRAAREMLGLATPEQTRRILDHALSNRGNYRIELGVSVALTEVLRRDKTKANQIKLSPADIEMLLDFAGSGDRTLRIYAGEFLYDLANPDVARRALERASALPIVTDAETKNIRYNYLLVSQGGWAALPPADREQLAPALAAIGAAVADLPKTNELLQNLK
jgi:hypothetical protein